METYSGKSVYRGIAIGKIYYYERREFKLTEERVADAQAELERYQNARAEAEAQLKALYDKTLKEAGEEHAMIFDVHQMMLQDLDYNESVEHLIRDEKYNAEYAVNRTGREMAEIFQAMDDEYMRGRSADLIDISDRVVRNLAGIAEGIIDTDEPVIVLADDLSPSETVQMDKDKILAFVTKHGSANSHTAILARSMNIPALVKTDMELKKEYHGMSAVVNGMTGEFIIEPSEEIMSAMTREREKYLEELSGLRELIGEENVTSDGRKVKIYANIGSEKDLKKVLENDAGGIGLFRSEFLYLGREDYPSEEEQFEKYKEVLSGMEGKQVIIRTLDIGADKQADYFNLEHEENPAMGLRAIRLCLTRKELFRTQLRAIYRASAYGNAAIMFPMIISVAEIVKIKRIVEEVKEELYQEGVPFGEVQLGIMVETPAAVILSDRLAGEVDFFSIGTNDLTQYTLAIDRQNQNLDGFFDPHHEAVLRMIRMTVENGHKAGIWVGICGELAADDALTEEFMDMGVDELSVSPSYVLRVRKKVRSL